jgi:hypothetical protein
VCDGNPGEFFHDDRAQDICWEGRDEIIVCAEGLGAQFLCVGILSLWGLPLGGLLNPDYKRKANHQLRLNDLFEILMGIGGGDSKAYFPDPLGDQRKSWCTIGVVLHDELVVRNRPSTRSIDFDVKERLVQAAAKIVVTVVVTNDTTSKHTDGMSESHDECLMYQRWLHDK